MAKAKYRRFLRAIGWSVVLVLIGAIAVTPALADDPRPTIELSPREGPVGTKLYVTLTGFEPGVIDISFDAESNVIETDSSDDDGNLYTYFIVDEYPAGKYKIWATDSDDYQEINYFTVAPDIDLDEYTGTVGQEIVVNGTGFAANNDVNITFDGDGVAIDKTNEDGSFSGATFDVPESYNGNHTVKATDKDGNYSTIEFATMESIAISAKTAAAGTGVTVSGTGFLADGDITIQLANDKIAVTETDDNGSFSDSFVVPAMVKGTYKMKIGDGSNSAYTDFTILCATTINPVMGNVGTEVTVSGAGFAPNATVLVKYENTQVVKTTTDDNGTFETSFSAPVSEHGDHTVTITDAITTEEMVFTMESDPPPTPRLLLPANNTKVSMTPQFSWESVKDPSGVTYSLQVAADANYSEVVIIKSALTDPEYTITEGERMEPVKKETPYYWRVRATDRASNNSEWTSSGTFYMGISLAKPPSWVQWGLTGLGITLFGFLFATFLNRLRRLALGD